MGVPPAPLPPGARQAPAARDWREQLLDDPASLEARYGLAQASLAQGDTPAAIAWLSDACRVAPGAPAAARRLAELLRAQGGAAQAVAVLERQYAAGARDRGTLLALGRALEEAGEWRQAIERYREAVTREPGLVEGHARLARALAAGGEHGLAAAHAQAAVNLAPDDPAALNALAAVLRRCREAGAPAPPLDDLHLPPQVAAAALAAARELAARN